MTLTRFVRGPKADWNWPTATKQDGESSGRHTTDPEKSMHPGTTLTDASRMWPTPAASIQNLDESPTTWLARAEKLKEKGINGNGAGMPLKETVKAGADLSDQSQAWPTPAARDYRSPNSKESEERRFSGDREKSGQQLPNFVAHSPSSPQARVISVSGGELSPTDRLTVLRRRLNPAFVCWLMGWPWWWTNPAPNSFARAATGSYLFKLRLHLASLLDGYATFLASGSPGYDKHGFVKF